MSSKESNAGQAWGTEGIEDFVIMAVPPPLDRRGVWLKVKEEGGKSLKYVLISRDFDQTSVRHRMSAENELIKVTS